MQEIILDQSMKMNKVLGFFLINDIWIAYKSVSELKATPDFFFIAS